MGKVTFFFFFKKLFGGMQSELILNLFVLYPMFSLLGSIALIASLIVNIPGIVGTKTKLVYSDLFSNYTLDFICSFFI